MQELTDGHCDLCGTQDLCVDIGSKGIKYCGSCFHEFVIPYIENCCQVDTVINEEQMLLTGWELKFDL